MVQTQEVVCSHHDYCGSKQLFAALAGACCEAPIPHVMAFVMHACDAIFHSTSGALLLRE